MQKFADPPNLTATKFIRYTVFTLCAQSYSTTLQYVAISCDFLHMQYY